MPTTPRPRLSWAPCCQRSTARGGEGGEAGGRHPERPDRLEYQYGVLPSSKDAFTLERACRDGSIRRQAATQSLVAGEDACLAQAFSGYRVLHGPKRVPRCASFTAGCSTSRYRGWTRSLTYGELACLSVLVERIVCDSSKEARRRVTQ